MAELVTTGIWIVDPAKAERFVDDWSALAAWASGHPGAGRLRLGRDVGERQRFVSFAPWETEAAVRAWKGAPGFKEHLARALRHVDDFHPAELEVVASAEADSPIPTPTPATR